MEKKKRVLGPARSDLPSTKPSSITAEKLTVLERLKKLETSLEEVQTELQCLRDFQVKYLHAQFKKARSSSGSSNNVTPSASVEDYVIQTQPAPTPATSEIPKFTGYWDLPFCAKCMEDGHECQ